MALQAACFAALLAVGAIAQQDGTLLLQSTVSVAGELAPMEESVYSAFQEEGSFGLLPDSAPTWCKKKGQAKWAVAEAKRLKAEGKETPKWMDEIVEEDTKWANRWAACKVAEPQQANEEVPQWMLENGRKGVLEAAAEKAAELQEEIEEMEEEKEKDEALVSAQGDVQTANQRMLAKNREFSARTVSSQFRVLESALEDLDRAEADLQNDGAAKGPNRKYKQALRKAEAASKLLTKLLERKAAMLNAQMSAPAQ